MYTQEEFEEQLEGEGFNQIYVREDEGDTAYPPHEHETYTVHIILEGEMTFTGSDGRVRLLRPGDRVDVLPGEQHTAVIGPEGCTYLVGEK